MHTFRIKVQDLLIFEKIHHLSQTSFQEQNIKEVI
jgi:hypothetical protein